ncbi:hypothetical protein D3C87_1828270 [compost metagenome]
MKQEVPNAVQKALIELSEKVYNKLTDPLRSVENVTQWCKREECWNNALNIQYNLPVEIEHCLTMQGDT